MVQSCALEGVRGWFGGSGSWCWYEGESVGVLGVVSGCRLRSTV